MAIRHPELFRTVVGHLRREGRPQNQIDRFGERWARLRSHEAFPCPLCYLDRNEEQPLAALNAIGDVEPVVCSACKQQFDIPIRPD